MKKLEGSIKRNFYDNAEEALVYARQHEQNKVNAISEWDLTNDEYIEPKKAEVL